MNPSESIRKFYKLIANERQSKSRKRSRRENDLEAENDRKGVSDRVVGNDLEVEKVLKVEIGHAVVNDQAIAENDPIPEIVQFHESVYLYQEYDDHNEGHVTGRGQLIDHEIGHVIDQTIILFMIGKKRRIENEANHVIKSLIGNGHGEFFLSGEFF